jgi:hypothetical protein
MSIFLSEPVKSKLYISHSSITLTKSRHEQIILDHPFNNSLDIFFPSIIISEKITNLFNNDFFYYKVDLPLSWFIERDFIRDYVKSGKLKYIFFFAEIIYE